MGRENELQSLFSFCSLLAKVKTSMAQGGKIWQPFGKVKNGHKIFRQARIWYFHICVAFAHNCKWQI